jgi:uncharacterized protein (DUF433 family)
MPAKTSGRYTVADPAICHGEPTFRGTRIMACGCAGQVASGMVWEAIIEVVRMAREAMVAYAPRLVKEMTAS